MPKMYQKTLDGRTPPGPAGGAYAPTRGCNGGLLLRGGSEVKGGEGAYL